MTNKRIAPTAARLRQLSQRSTSCRKRQDNLQRRRSMSKSTATAFSIKWSFISTAYPCTRTFANKQLNKALDLGSQAAGFPQAPTAGTPQHHLQGDQASVACWALSDLCRTC